MSARDHYRAEVHYPVPPRELFAALCRPAGRDGWWSTQGGSVAGEGSRLQLVWSETDFIEFEVTGFDEPGSMRWQCVAQHDRNLPEPDEWVGTALDFEIAGDGSGGAVLRFTHDGLEPALDCYVACERGWDFFLRRSIRSLLVDGVGMPYDAPADLSPNAKLVRSPSETATERNDE